MVHRSELFTKTFLAEAYSCLQVCVFNNLGVGVVLNFVLIKKLSVSFEAEILADKTFLHCVLVSVTKV